MKNKKILIISLCAVLIALVAAASVMLKRNSISKHSLIYADVNNRLISYKISEKAETRISFDGYSEYLLVGKYIGGDYCCVSKGENSFFDVLLIKNGNIEKTYQLSFCPDEIAATDGGIYCLTNGKIYRLSTADNTESLYKDNVYTHDYRLNMLITDKGDLVYSRQENDGSVSLVLDCDGQETDVLHLILMILLPWDLIQITDFYIKTKAAIIRRWLCRFTAVSSRNTANPLHLFKLRRTASLPSNIKDRFWASAPMSI